MCCINTTHGANYIVKGKEGVVAIGTGGCCIYIYSSVVECWCRAYISQRRCWSDSSRTHHGQYVYVRTLPFPFNLDISKVFRQNGPDWLLLDTITLLMHAVITCLSFTIHYSFYRLTRLPRSYIATNFFTNNNCHSIQRRLTMSC